jgi:ABC-type nitrate/sulfonate/bicarbonate transport system substrate-binding protein
VRHEATFTPVLVACALLACGSCRERPPDADRVIRLAVGGNDFSDVPRLAAQRGLRARGYTIRQNEYTQADLSVLALSRRENDMGVISIALGWAAVAKGAPIVTVMEASGGRHVLLTRSSIRTCRDLEGRRVGVNSLGATGDQLLRTYLAEECPGAKPTMLVIQHTRNRMAAVVSGATDGAIVFRDDALAAMELQPGRVHVLADLGLRWPTLMNLGVFVNRQYGEEHEDVVVEYLKACLTAYRTLGTNPALLAREAPRLLNYERNFATIAATFVAGKTWNPNGGTSHDAVRDTIAFLVRNGTLDATIDAGRLVDRRYLERALAELGAR